MLINYFIIIISVYYQITYQDSIREVDMNIME